MLILSYEQLYRFDLDGFLVLRGAVPEEVCDKANWIVDRLCRVENDRLCRTEGDRLCSTGGNRLCSTGGNRAAIRVDQVVNQEPALQLLVDTIDLSPLFGGDRYRIDHDYLQVLRQGKISKGLHGGGVPYDPSQFYMARSQSMFNGLVAMAIALNDAPAEYGGFMCIRGSHKASFNPPADTKSFVETIGVKAGDVILFTEALTHGTADWVGQEERRSIFIKFAPSYMAWSHHRYSFKHELVMEPQVCF